MTGSVFNARLTLESLVAKTDFDDKLSSLNRKATTNKTTHLLVENVFKKMEIFDSSYFKGKSQKIV